MVQTVRVVQVKEMDTVVGDMVAVLDTQETTIIMGKEILLTTFYIFSLRFFSISFLSIWIK